MADETGERIANTGGTADPAALHVALDPAHGASAEARDYLRKQSRLADLQIENLTKLDEFEVSHLRFRRFSDYARFSLEVAGFLVVVLLVAGLGTMVWNASQDRDLVVEAFSVPPDLVQTGLTGSVLANRVLDRFGVMDRNGHAFIGEQSSYHNDTVEDTRVEIPDTGISVGEVNRYLRGWLGHETHVTGELVRDGATLSLTVRYGANPGLTAQGPADKLDALIQKAAENLFLAAEPLRLTTYLAAHGRIAEARAIADREALVGSDAHRAAAYTALAVTDYWAGDSRRLGHDGAEAVRLDPNDLTAWYALTSSANNFDSEEKEWRWLKQILSVIDAGTATAESRMMNESMPVTFRANLQLLEGDYLGAIATCKAIRGQATGACFPGNVMGCYGALHDVGATSVAIGKLDPSQPDNVFQQAQNAAFVSDWPLAVALSKKGEAMVAHDPSHFEDRDIFLRPFEAIALAHIGDIKTARTLLAPLPPDCDQCLRARGQVEAAARNWSEAARWFQIVSDRSPHIPQPDTDWGAMLLAKGDLDGAIAKFESAHAKGPKFADPLELWGETLIRKNRSDLARAKFEEAATDAPNWGRLHLKWGEALLWSGDKDGAQKQFALASSLFLTAAERSELARLH